MTYCTGEEPKATKPGGGPSPTSPTMAGDGGCTGEVVRSGNGRWCASSALSIPCWLVVTPGMSAESEKVFEVGRDCRRRILVNHEATQQNKTITYRRNNANVILVAGHRG